MTVSLSSCGCGADLCIQNVCTNFVYTKCVYKSEIFFTDGRLRRRDAQGKPSSGFPRPFPRLENTEQKSQSSLCLRPIVTATAESTVLFVGGRGVWVLSVLRNFLVHFFDGALIIRIGLVWAVTPSLSHYAESLLFVATIEIKK